MSTKMTIKEQAQAYVARTPFGEVITSNHYLTAKRHCNCGECFCCEVFKAANATQKPLRSVIEARRIGGAK